MKDLAAAAMFRKHAKEAREAGYERLYQTLMDEATMAMGEEIVGVDLVQVADRNLEAAGAYGRTVERWWRGVYGKFSVKETAEMDPKRICQIITVESRRF